MIDNEHNDSLRKRLNQIQREHIEHTYGRKDAMYEGTKEPKYGGGMQTEEQADIERSRLEESFGAGMSTTKYIKQIPKLDGAGKPNMEMDINIDNNIPADKIKRGKRIPKNTFGRIQQEVISGGSKAEKHDLVDVLINKLMHGKAHKKHNEELEAEVKGAGWNHAIKEIGDEGDMQAQNSMEMEGGARPKARPVKKDIRLGRGADNIEGDQIQKPDKRKSRALAIKKIMSEKGLKMIEASKYIKEHKIAY